MRIIQSFYQISDNTCYRVKGNNDNYLLNFYSLLLSYVTISKLYGSVTMYCNEMAYDKMLKYIPYNTICKNEVHSISTVNYNNEWGLLKFKVFEQQNEPFIHIDGDVFLFNDLLSNYNKNNEYDGIVQSIEIDRKYAIYDTFYVSNRIKLIELGLIDEVLINNVHDKYGLFIGYNNGVVGFKNIEFMREYVKLAYELNDLINKGILVNAKHQTMIFEQFLLYVLTQKQKKIMYEILPSNDIINIGYSESGDKHGYTHLLSGNKYVSNFIQLVRTKIIKEFPEYIACIKDFEKTLGGTNITYLKHSEESNLMKNIVEKW